MKNSIATFYILCTVISTSCFAINFGPGPGGGGNHDSEKVNIQENSKELLADEEENIPADPKELKKS